MAEAAASGGTHRAVAQEDEDFEVIDIDHVMATRSPEGEASGAPLQDVSESSHEAPASHNGPHGPHAVGPAHVDRTQDAEEEEEEEEDAEGEEEEVRHATAESLVRLSKGPTSYRALLRRLASEMPELPACSVELRNVSAVVDVPVAEQDHAIPNIARNLWGMFKKVAAVGKKAKTRPVYRLHDVTVTFPAGTTTLILAPPGHGKTSILQAIAGILQPTSGEVLYNGSAAEQMEARVPRLTAYVGQDDVHMPQLTVRETLTFAAQNANVAAHLPDTELVQRYTEERVELMLRILGLTNCADTIVGNDLVRGVSGGEKRRVSIGEQLITNARCLLLDQYSTGLDASTTIDITRSLSAWAHLTGGTVVATMLQPPPEVVDMYDNVLVLREGQVVYAGPREELRPYFQRAGFYCPPDMDTADIVTEVVTHPSKWVAKFRREQEEQERGGVVKGNKPPITTAQMRGAFENQEQQLSMATRPSGASNAPAVASDGSLRNNFSRAQYGRSHAKSFAQHFALCVQRQFRLMRRDPQFLVAHLVQSLFLALILGSLFWQLGTDEFQLRAGLLLFVPTLLAFNNMAEVPVAMAAREVVYRQQHAGFYPTMAYTLAVNCVHLPLAIAESVVFSCGVYWMTGFVDEGDRFLFFLFVLCIVASATAAMFRAISYAVPSMELGQVMIGPANGMLVMFCGITITRSNIPPWFIWLYYFSPFSWAIRTLAINEFQSDRYAAPASNATDSPTLGELYLKSYEFQTGEEWKWLGVLYLAAYLIVMVAIGNFVLSRGKPDGSRGTSRVEETDDENLHLSYADDKEGGEGKKAGRNWSEASQRGGVAAAVGPESGDGEAAIVNIRSTLVALDATSGTDDDPADGVADTADANGTSASRIDARAITASTSNSSSNTTYNNNSSSSTAVGGGIAGEGHTLPFEAASLVFRDLCYDVVVKKDRKHKETKRLLSKVTGYARAGELTALMGVTGAGKTTLLDVLARRKTGGTTKGSILVNGRVPSSSRFARMVGYCEQNDLHEPYTTVEEALHFSAALRLPTSVNEATRKAFVEEIMELIELRHLRDRVVGVPGQDNGLSQGQRKRLTLGVELVANTSILFLDEPTSQLDSREAEVVMRVVRNVARTGRTVVCTIHQPNAELFAMFDQLLLLARGGRVVFHGPISGLQPYLEAIPGVDPKASHVNPATWMLDVIGASSAGVAEEKVQPAATAKDEEASAEGVGGGQGAEVPPSRFPGIYEQSQVRQAVEAEVQCLVKEGNARSGAMGDSTRDDDKRALARPSKTHKMALVLRRAFVSYWRNVDYNLTRMIVIPMQSLLFGLMYLDVNESTLAGVVSSMAGIFSVAMFCGSIHLLTAIPVVVGARPVVAREQAGRMYSGWMHSVSLGLVEVPYLLVSGVISAAIFYFMAGLSLDTEPLILYFLAHTVLGFVLAYFSQLLSNTFPSAEAATLGASTVLSIMFLFGGLFLPGPDMPNGYRWIWYANFLKHALTTMVVPQFYCEAPADNSTASACPTIDYVTADGVVQVTTSDYVEDFLGVSYANRWESMVALVAYAVGFLIFAILAARFINHVKR